MAHSATMPVGADVFHPRPLDEQPRQGVSPAVEALHRGLMEEMDPSRRAQIHVELGTLALRDGRLEAAARHFHEALTLDPRLEPARRWLDELGERRADSQARGLKGALSRLLPTRR